MKIRKLLAQTQNLAISRQFSTGLFLKLKINQNEMERKLLQSSDLDSLACLYRNQVFELSESIPEVKKNEKLFRLMVNSIDLPIIQHFDEEIASRKDLILLERNISIDIVPPHLMNDQDLVLKILEKAKKLGHEQYSKLFETLVHKDWLKDEKFVEKLPWIDFDLLPDMFKSNPIVLLKTLDGPKLVKYETIAESIKFWNEETKKNSKLIRRLIERFPDLLEIFKDPYIQERKLVKKAVSVDGNCIRILPEEWRNDYELVLRAVKRDGSSLKYASDELRNNLKIVKAACWQNPRAFEFAQEDIRRNPKFVKQLIKYYCNEYRYGVAYLESENDINFTKDLKLITKFILPELRNNLKFVTSIIKYDSEIVYHPGFEKYQNDLEILSYCSEISKDLKRLKMLFENESFRVNYMKRVYSIDNPNIPSLEFIEISNNSTDNSLDLLLNLLDRTNIGENEAFIILLTSRLHGKITKLPERYSNCRDMIALLLRICDDKPVDWFASVNSNLLLDKEFMLTMIRFNNQVVKFIDERLKKDRDFIIRVWARLKIPLDFMIEFPLELKDFIEIVGLNISVYSHLNEELKSNRDFVKEILKINPTRILRDAPESIQLDKEIVQTAIQYGIHPTCINKKLMDDPDVLQQLIEKFVE